MGGGAGRGGGRPPNLSIGGGGGHAPPTLGYNTQGCLRVQYCMSRFCNSVYWLKPHNNLNFCPPPPPQPSVASSPPDAVYRILYIVHTQTVIVLQKQQKLLNLIPINRYYHKVHGGCEVSRVMTCVQHSKILSTGATLNHAPFHSKLKALVDVHFQPSIHMSIIY